MLAAITASFRGANWMQRRSVVAGSGAAVTAGVGTSLFVVWLIGRFHGGEFDVQAATGIPSLIVLLVVMNSFFHKIYWTGGFFASQAPPRAFVLRSGGESATDAARAGVVGFHIGVPRVF